MKVIILILLYLLFSLQGLSQITLIPDPWFEMHLINVGIDSDGIVNGQVLTSDVENVLFLSVGLQITDLTGIEDFVALESLDILNADIVQINLSNNLNLKYLSIEDVSLESLNLETNINLLELVLFVNNIIYNYTSPLTILDLSNNLQLLHLNIQSTLNTQLDLSANINLGYLELIGMEEMTFLNIQNGNNTGIFFLNLMGNTNLACMQVDDPQAVIDAIDPPYNTWFIENNPIITDDCQLGTNSVDESLVSLFPNPVRDTLMITSVNSRITKVKIYNILGMLLLQKENEIQQLDVSSLPAGLLLVEVVTDKVRIMKKVIKMD